MYYIDVCVEWPRYTKWDTKIGAGVKGSFFSSGETSLFVLNPSCERGIEGRLQSKPMGGMTQGAQRSLLYPDISPLDGEINVFPTIGTFLWNLARVH